MTSPVLPPISENLFIPEAIDFNFEHNAKQPFFKFANHSTPGKVTVITHLEFGRAAHRVAHALRPNRSGIDGQVVALIALADTVLYQTITTGLIIAGFVPFLISSRNSPAAIVNLLQKTNCRHLITTRVTLKLLLDGIQTLVASAGIELCIEEIPSLATAYPKLGHETAEDPFQRYPRPETRPSRDDVCFYLHSSGSTGFPKAIAQTYLALVHWALFPSVTEIRDHIPRLTIGSMALPPFHTLGIIYHILCPLYGITPVSLYPPTATSEDLLPIVPSPENILEHTRNTQANSIIIVPSLVQTWSTSPSAVEFLKTLELLIFSGGSLAPKSGDFLVNSGVKLRPLYGMTETGAFSTILPLKGDEYDWQYMKFHESVNIRWVPQGDGTFENYILTWEKHQSMVENLSDVRGYATSDLWENHPTKKYLWKTVGRLDDVIVHSSGEKTVPALIENVITSSPLVQGAVMFGREREEAGIIIEPLHDHGIDRNDPTQLAALRNKLWPVVEEANKDAPAFSRIFKEMILITAAHKPLPRTGKGTVMRKAALSLYDDEIKALYEAVEMNTKPTESIIPPVAWRADAVEDWLVQQAADLTTTNHISPSIDLFEQGFDSLSATFLRHRIVGALRTSDNAVVRQAVHGFTQNTVYAYPSVKKLAAHVAGLISHTDETSSPIGGHTHVEQMIEKYSVGLQPLLSKGVSIVPRGLVPATVLLTGSSGNLGSQILSALLEDDRVERVYALNRRATGSQTIMERHLARFKDKGLDIGLLNSPKLILLTGDTNQPDLGLDRGGYGQLCRSVNIIIHNAWKLDFNLSLSSFEPNIRGTRHLIDLARSGPNARSIRFLFTSSISSAQGWNHSRGPFPEEVMMDSATATGAGYGEGKYVTDRVLAQSGLQTTSFRIGQISGGPPNGAWATSDWFPIIVKSSLALGALPVAEGVVSWLPMDAVAEAIIDVAFTTGSPPAALNLVHPQPIEWTSMISNIKDAIKKVISIDLMLIPFHDWFSRLETHAKDVTVQEMNSIPAIKLLEFIRGLSHANDGYMKSGTKDVEANGFPTLATEKMRKISARICALRQLDANDAMLWVEYWRDTGFLG